MSATSEEVESDITITDRAGRPLAVFDGFSVQSLSASSRMSPDRIDKGLYEIQWCVSPMRDDDAHDQHEAATSNSSWLVLVDDSGVGAALADELRRRGHRVLTVEHQSVGALTEIDGGYRDEHPDAPSRWASCSHTSADEGDFEGIVNCWPLDICSSRPKAVVWMRTSLTRTIS